MEENRVQIIGVHPVKTDDICHLIELVVKDLNGPIDMCQFTQPVDGQPQSSWQVPYMDQFLNKDGTEIIGDVMYHGNDYPNLWVGDVRFAFFIYFLDFEKPLQTPFGPVNLSKPSKMPKRLKMVEFIPST